MFEYINKEVPTAIKTNSGRLYCLEHESFLCDCSHQVTAELLNPVVTKKSKITVLGTNMYSISGYRYTRASLQGPRYLRNQFEVVVNQKPNGFYTIINNGYPDIDAAINSLVQAFPELPSYRHMLMYENQMALDVSKYLHDVVGCTLYAYSCIKMFNEERMNEVSEAYAEGGIKAVASMLTGVNHTKLNKLSWRAGWNSTLDFKVVLQHYSADSLFHFYSDLDPASIRSNLRVLDKALANGIKLPLKKLYDPNDTMLLENCFVLIKSIKQLNPEYNVTHKFNNILKLYKSLRKELAILSCKDDSDIRPLYPDYSCTSSGYTVKRCLSKLELIEASSLLNNCLADRVLYQDYLNLDYYLVCEDDSVVGCITTSGFQVVESCFKNNVQMNGTLSGYALLGYMKTKFSLK